MAPRTTPTFVTGAPLSVPEAKGTRVRDGQVEMATMRLVFEECPPVTIVFIPTMAPSSFWDALFETVEDDRAEGNLILRAPVLEASPLPEKRRDANTLLGLKIAELRTSARFHAFGLEVASATLLAHDSYLLPDVALATRLNAQRGVFARFNRLLDYLVIRTTTQKNISRRVHSLTRTPLALNEEITLRYARTQALAFADALANLPAPGTALLPQIQGAHTLCTLAEMGYRIERLDWLPVVEATWQADTAVANPTTSA